MFILFLQISRINTILKSMKKNIFFLCLTNLIILCSCSQDNTFLGPGYRWDLFENTIDWDLAKAVAKEDTAEIYTIIKNGIADINLQEPKFGRTLLMLAVGNDKELSTAELLKMGADIKLRDQRDDQAIHEAVAYINLRKHSLSILKLLLTYRADANSISTKGSNSVPLEGAVENFSCAKLLLNYGANPYFKKDDTFLVWFRMMIMDLPFDETIHVAKYIIVDKKLLIPNPISYTYSERKPIDILSLLNKYDVHSDPKKQKAKEEIVNYLHQIDFPKNNVYK
jgi:hypothetical protein